MDNTILDKYFFNAALRFPGWDTASAKLYHQRRELADGQLLFLVNSSMEKTAKGSLVIKGKDAVLLNTQTGAITDYPEMNTGKELKISSDIPEAGSLLHINGVNVKLNQKERLR